MKRILRALFIAMLALYLSSQAFSGMVFEKGIQSFLAASGALGLALIFAKPLINLLLLPINLVTFGLFRWLSSGVVLYLVTLLLKDFKVEKFYYAGISTPWIDIPEINLEGLLAFAAFAFFVSFITSFVYWLRK